VEGEVTYFHEEQRFGRWLWALVLVFGLAVVIPLIGRPVPLATLAFAPIVIAVVFALIALSRLDVDVDDQGIHIAFHMLWPTRHIALEDVKSTRATGYSPLLWGGWGVHYMFLRGWAFNTGGHEGVLVETTHGNVMIGSRRAKELEAAITKAIAAPAGR
jgi:DUF3093 family protein